MRIIQFDLLFICKQIFFLRREFAHRFLHVHTYKNKRTRAEKPNEARSILFLEANTQMFLK